MKKDKKNRKKKHLVSETVRNADVTKVINWHGYIQDKHEIDLIWMLLSLW